MSEEISDIETDNDDVRRNYRRRLEDAARLTEAEREARLPVWEVRRPAYRPQRVSNSYTSVHNGALTIQPE